MKGRICINNDQNSFWFVPGISMWEKQIQTIKKCWKKSGVYLKDFKSGQLSFIQLLDWFSLWQVYEPLMILFTFDVSFPPQRRASPLLPYVITKHVTLSYWITQGFCMKEVMAVSYWWMFLHLYCIFVNCFHSLWKLTARWKVPIFEVHLQYYHSHEATVGILSSCVLARSFFWTPIALTACVCLIWHNGYSCAFLTHESSK